MAKSEATVLFRNVKNSKIFVIIEKVLSPRQIDYYINFCFLTFFKKITLYLKHFV